MIAANHTETDRSLATMVHEVEQALAAYYGFDLKASAIDHLIDRQTLMQVIGREIADHPELSARGSVWLVPGDNEAHADGAPNTDETFIGVHFDPSLLQKLRHQTPLERLDDDNLDEFCVIIEEISHFHLILNRGTAQRNVTKTELEWQGEIDKLLIAGLTLEKQCGKPHLLPLARKLYDMAGITGADASCYWEATRYAARYWYQAISRMSHPMEAQPELRWKYRASWQEKKSALTAAPFSIAS